MDKYKFLSAEGIDCSQTH